MPWRWGAAKDRRKLKGTNWRYLQLSTPDMAADSVIGTAMKSCIHKHTFWSEAPEATKLNNVILFKVVLAASDPVIRVCEVPLLLFIAVPLTYHQQWPTSTAGDSFAKRTVLSRQYSLSPEEKIYRQCRLHRRAVYRWCHWHLCGGSCARNPPKFSRVSTRINIYENPPVYYM